MTSIVTPFTVTCAVRIQDRETEESTASPSTLWIPLALKLGTIPRSGERAGAHGRQCLQGTKNKRLKVKEPCALHWAKSEQAVGMEQLLSQELQRLQQQKTTTISLHYLKS